MSALELVPGALTENERELALKAWDYADERASLPGRRTTDARRWGNLTLEAYDAVAAELERLKAEMNDYAVLRGELATIFGPGTPRSGESVPSYWLRRIGETLAETEDALRWIRKFAESQAPHHTGFKHIVRYIDSHKDAK